LAIEIALLTLRCDTVGVRLAAVCAATLLISCSISSRTLPLAAIRGFERCRAHGAASD